MYQQSGPYLSNGVGVETIKCLPQVVAPLGKTGAPSQNITRF